MIANSTESRHAFLVIAHSQRDQVGMLMDLLDDRRNDIFVQLDAGGSVRPEDLVVDHANLTVLPPRRLRWAGSSLVEATVDLLREATAMHHDYYHLLSGACLPLVSQDEIHRRLMGESRQFVEFQPHNDHWARWKVGYRHPFVESTDYPNNLAARIASHIAVRTQMALRMNRFRGTAIQPRNASQWFSITHECAAWVVGNAELIRFISRGTMAADEVFLATLLKLPDAPAFELVAPDGPESGNLRHIVWDQTISGNHPLTLTIRDLPALEQASRTHLFARKFSRRDNPEIVDLVYSRLREHGRLATGSDLAPNR